MEHGGPKIGVCSTRRASKDEKAKPLKICRKQKPPKKISKTWHQKKLASHSYQWSYWFLNRCQHNCQVQVKTHEHQSNTKKDSDKKGKYLAMVEILSSNQEITYRLVIQVRFLTLGVFCIKS